MNPIKKAAASTINFVSAHKLPIVFVATAVTTAVIATKTMGNQLETAEEFIKENGLYNKFLTDCYNVEF